MIGPDPPDGRIAFASNRDTPAPVIYIMNIDGSGVAQLTDYFETDPSFSPDGTKIAFSTYRDGNWEVYVMNADGSNQARLTELAGLDAVPSWNGSAPPAAANQCQDGGWALFTDPSFKNQGECIKYVNNGGN